MATYDQSNARSCQQLARIASIFPMKNLSRGLRNALLTCSDAASGLRLIGDQLGVRQTGEGGDRDVVPGTPSSTLRDGRGDQAGLGCRR